MDAPAIGYFKTPDGLNIAYCAAGDGEPLILTPLGVNHVELVWASPLFKRTYEHLVQWFRSSRRERA